MTQEADSLARKEFEVAQAKGDSLAAFPERAPTVPVPGERIVGGEVIKFENVDIITPDRTILARGVCPFFSQFALQSFVLDRHLAVRSLLFRVFLQT